MSKMPPDFGQSLMSTSVPGVVLAAYPLAKIATLESGGWRTTSIMSIFDAEYAVTVDFVGDVLKQLQALIGPRDVGLIQRALAMPGGKPVIWAEMPEFEVAAALGCPQDGVTPFDAVSVRPA